MLNYEQGALRSSVMCFTLIIFLYPVASAAKTSTARRRASQMASQMACMSQWVAAPVSFRG
eukprot:312313-Rhodomonas_salina.1